MQALFIALIKQTSSKATKMLGNNAMVVGFLVCLPANQNADKQQNLTKQNNGLDP